MPLVKPSLVALANTHVRIEQAVAWAGGGEIPTVETGSLKVHCPFGPVYHADGGAEPALRVYPGPNNAWCFACSEFYTPVRICALAWGMPYDQVAVELLRRAGHKPVTYAQHWQSVLAPQADLGREDLAEALRCWLAERFPDWADLQFQPAVARYLARCLGLLESVSTPADCGKWLEGCKQVMETACRKVAQDT